MAGIVYPVDAVTGAPSYTGRMLRNSSVGPQAGGATSARPLGGFSGVRPGTVNPCAATSTTWTVTPFAGTLDGEAAAIAGVYNYAFNANQTGSVTAAAGSARVDRLDVQLSDPAEGDGTSTPGIAVVYTVGTPGTGVPNAAPARSHLLCYINVPASGGGSPTITYNAPFTAAAGGVLPVSGVANYPASPYIGQYIDDATLGLLRWNGTLWLYPAGALPGGSVVRTGTSGNFTAASWTYLGASTGVWTTDQPTSNITLANALFTCTVAGIYDAEAGIQMDTAVNAWLAIKKNDTSASGTGAVATQTGVGTTGTTGVTARRRVRLAVGDTLAPAIFVSATAKWSDTNLAGSFFGVRYVEPLR